MKKFSEMTKKELFDEMVQWFPWLKDPLPYQPREKSKDQKEYDRAWSMWRADMQDAVDYQNEQRLLGKQ